MPTMSPLLVVGALSALLWALGPPGPPALAIAVAEAATPAPVLAPIPTSEPTTPLVLHPAQPAPAVILSPSSPSDPAGPGSGPLIVAVPNFAANSSIASTATPVLGEPPVTEQADEVGPERHSACVRVGDEHCPPAGELCRCRLVNGTATVVCCDVTTQLQLMESLNCHGLAGANITALHAKNVTLHSLDLGVLDVTKLSLPQLESLSITDGHITEINGNLSAKNLACFNLSSNSLINVSNENTFLFLPSLATLDLSGNDLQQIYKITAHNTTTVVPEFHLDISGNNKLSCESIMDLIKKMRNLHFSHDNTTYCLAAKSFQWFNSTEKVPLSSVIMINKLEKECPRGETGPCSCGTNRLDMVPGKPPTFSVSVDCSNRHLTSLPKTLPKNTISLNVSSNNITNLEELGMNKAYTNIRMFYADDNQITSITVLEGSTFINSFWILSLKNNNISSLPTYILSNVLDRNDGSLRTLNLGLNRLKCDCSTAQSVKMWLNANSKHIRDYTEVLCENMPERVYELDQNKVCVVQSDWTEYVYYVVALEVTLLILLISKVSYDYWVFKSAGYLPWPASKMPKLPCDRLFESCW